MSHSFFEILDFLSNPAKPVAYARPFVEKALENGYEHAMNTISSFGVIEPITETVKANCGLFTCEEATNIIGYTLTESVSAYAPSIAITAAAAIVSLYALKKCCWNSSTKKDRITSHHAANEDRMATHRPYWDRSHESRIIIHRPDGYTIDVGEDVNPKKLQRILKVI